MENEILQQILEKLNTLEQGQTRLEQGQTGLEQKVTKIEQKVTKIEQKVTKIEQKVTKIEQKVTKIEVTIENEIKPSIQAVAEGHGILDRKLDDIKDIGEKVLKLQDSDRIQNVAIHELARRTANK